MGRKVLSEALDASIYDLSKMTSYELKEVLAPIRDAVSKRVVAIKKSGVPSPALKSLTSSGGLLSSKGKDKTALIGEINRGKSFLNMKTSSIKGSRSYLKEITRKQTEGEKSGILKSLDEIAPDYTELSDRSKGRFWETLHKLKQDGFQMNPEQYDTANNLIRVAFKGKNPSESFLKTIPDEAKEYVKEHSELDYDYNRSKLRGKNLDSYWAEKIAKMVEAYDDWQKMNPEEY